MPTARSIPRKIIKKFIAKFNGKEIFTQRLALRRVRQSLSVLLREGAGGGNVQFAWHDDDGSVYKSEQTVNVG